MHNKSELTEADQHTLLEIARESVVAAAAGGFAPPESSFADRLTPGLRRVLGGFVTLQMHGELRGCIGEIEPRRPIWKVVRDHAADAALHDPRFHPVRPDEVAFLTIEISVLSPPRRAGSWDEIEIGRHGVVLSLTGRRAVFLPQVALEQHWDRPTLLSHLALKAGLPPDAWRSGAQFDVFEAQVFREPPFPGSGGGSRAKASNF